MRKEYGCGIKVENKVNTGLGDFIHFCSMIVIPVSWHDLYELGSIYVFFLNDINASKCTERDFSWWRLSHRTKRIKSPKPVFTAFSVFCVYQKKTTKTKWTFP